MTTPKKKAGRRKKLKKTDPDFYSKIGSLGGINTRKNHEANYFSKIARLSHVRRKERAAGLAPQIEPGAAN